MVLSPFKAWGKAMGKLTTAKANHSRRNANHRGAKNRIIITGAEGRIHFIGILYLDHRG